MREKQWLTNPGTTFKEKIAFKIKKKAKEALIKSDAHEGMDFFRHIAPKILALRQQAGRFFAQSAEKISRPLAHPDLISTSLKQMTTRSWSEKMSECITMLNQDIANIHSGFMGIGRCLLGNWSHPGFL